MFPSPTTVLVTQAAAGVANTHQLSEMSTSLPLTNVEVDALIVVRIFRDAANVLDTCTNPVFLFKADAHFETDRLATINKNPNFYA